jgi:hypothetical protein
VRAKGARRGEGTPSPQAWPFAPKKREEPAPTPQPPATPEPQCRHIAGQYGAGPEGHKRVLKTGWQGARAVAGGGSVPIGVARFAVC